MYSNNNNPELNHKETSPLNQAPPSQNNSWFGSLLTGSWPTSSPSDSSTQNNNDILNTIVLPAIASTTNPLLELIKQLAERLDQQEKDQKTLTTQIQSLQNENSSLQNTVQEQNKAIKRLEQKVNEINSDMKMVSIDNRINKLNIESIELEHKQVKNNLSEAIVQINGQFKTNQEKHNEHSERMESVTKLVETFVDSQNEQEQLNTLRYNKLNELQDNLLNQQTELAKKSAEQTHQLNTNIAHLTNRQQRLAEISIKKKEPSSTSFFITKFNPQAFSEALPTIACGLEESELIKQLQAYRDVVLEQYRYFLETVLDNTNLAKLNDQSFVCEVLRPIMNDYFEISRRLNELLEYKKATLTFNLNKDENLKNNSQLTLLNKYLDASKNRKINELLATFNLTDNQAENECVTLIQSGERGLCFGLRALKHQQQGGAAATMIESILTGVQETLNIYKEYFYIVEIQNQIRGMSNVSIFETFVPGLQNSYLNYEENDVPQSAMKLFAANNNLEGIHKLLKDKDESITLFTKTLEYFIWQSLVKLTNIAAGLHYPSKAESALNKVKHALTHAFPPAILLELAIDAGIALHHERKQNNSQNILISIGIQNFMGAKDSLLSKLPSIISEIWVKHITTLADYKKENSLNNNNSSPMLFKQVKQKVSGAKNKVLNTQDYPAHMRLALFMGALIMTSLVEMPVDFNNNLTLDKLVAHIIKFMRTETHFLQNLENFFGMGSIKVNLSDTQSAVWSLHDVIRLPAYPKFNGDSSHLAQTPYGTLNILDRALLDALNSTTQSMPQPTKRPGF